MFYNYTKSIIATCILFKYNSNINFFMHRARERIKTLLFRDLDVWSVIGSRNHILVLVHINNIVMIHCMRKLH